jgi:hypothetical protein
MDPVKWLNEREPWSAPQYIPGAPHNLPIKRTTTPGEPGTPVAVRESYRIASFTDIQIAVGTTSTKFLDSPIGVRNFLGFRNASSVQNIFIGFNSDASTNSWLMLTPGAIVTFDVVVPQDDLYAVSTAAGGLLSYAYSTFPG